MSEQQTVDTTLTTLQKLGFNLSPEHLEQLPLGIKPELIVQILRTSIETAQRNEERSMRKLTHIEHTISGIVRTTDVINTESGRFKKKLTRLKQQNEEIHDNLYEMEKEVSKMDQHARRENMEILGLPTSVCDEQLPSKVHELLKNIGVNNIQPDHITHCQRIKSSHRYVYPRVLVRFSDRKYAIQSMKKRRKLPYIGERMGFGEALQFTDNLCPLYQEIYEKCQDLEETGDIRKVWTYKGIINYILTDNADELPTKVFHLHDLLQYFKSRHRGREKANEDTIGDGNGDTKCGGEIDSVPLLSHDEGEIDNNLDDSLLMSNSDSDDSRCFPPPTNPT